MSDTAGMEIPAGEPAAVDPAPVSDQPVVNDNPAWSSILGIIPEQLHPAVKGHLSEWDKGVQSRFEKVHSEYAGYKPFKEAGIAPEQLEAAMDFYRLADTNPELLYRQMGEFFGFSGQGQQEPKVEDGQESLEVNPEGEQFRDPRVDQLAQQQDQLRQTLIAQHNAKMQDEANKEIDTWITDLQTKHGGADKFDQGAMDFILQRALVEANRTGDYQKGLENGFQAYENLTNQIRTAPRANDGAPLVMPTGGGVPIVGKNPAELTGAQRRALGAQMIAQANAQ